MAVFFAKALAVLAALAPAICLGAVVDKNAQLPILLDAQSGSVDLKTGNEIFHKVRISQGDLVITADQAQASQPRTKLNFDNSLLEFRGAVKVTTAQGQLTADEAQNNIYQQRVQQGGRDGKAGRVRAANREDRQGGEGQR
jgi:lipopolysaccharide export system protein LptA